MIITTSSNSLLRSTLFAIDTNGKPVSALVELNTATMQAKKEDNVPFSVREFCFYATSQADFDTLVGLLQSEELDSFISLNVTGTPLSAFVASSTAIMFSMVSSLTPILTQCSDCGHRAIMYIDRDGNPWQVKRTSADDVEPTGTALNKNELTCVSCGKTGFFHAF